MLEGFLNTLNRWRLTVFAIGTVVMLVGGALASRLSINDSPERWLPGASVQAWNRFSEHFGYGDTIVLALQFHRTVRDDDLAFLKKLRSELLAVDGVGRVIDASLVADEIEQVPLTKLIAFPQDPNNDPYELYRGALFDDSAVWRTVTPEDSLEQRTLLYFIELQGQRDNFQQFDDLFAPPEATDKPVDQTAVAVTNDETNEQRRSVVADVYKVLDTNQNPDVGFHLIGGIVIQHELEHIARHIGQTFLPLCVALILLSLGVGFRSFTAVLIALVGSVWAVAVMLGAVSLAGWTMNVVTVGGPTLMVVIIVATTIHFAHFYSIHNSSSDSTGRAQDNGHASKPILHALKFGRRDDESERHFVRWVGVPCLGAAMTTGVGFLMLAFNELGPIREFGIELFAGSLLAFFGAYFVWLGVHPFYAAPGRWLSEPRLLKLQRMVTVAPRTTVWVLLAGMAVLFVASLSVKTDADPFSFFHSGSRMGRAFDHFSSRKFGLYNLDVVMVPKNRPSDPTELAAAQEADAEAARQFEKSLMDRPEVRNTVSAVSLGARQRMLELESVTNLTRYLVFVNTFRNWTIDRKDQGAIRVTFLVYDPGTGFRPLIDAMRANLPEDRFECFYTGAAANVATLSEGLIGGMTQGLITAAIVIAALCFFLFRSFKLMWLALPPNLFPVVLIFGVMGAWGVPLNSGSAMVATIALGVALNDTVHFIMHYDRRRKEGVEVDAILSEIFAELGRPIVLMSVVNFVGFGIFLLSDFRPLYHFGLLASIAMGSALIGDLVLLPNLLKVFDRRRARQPVPAGHFQHSPAVEPVRAPE